MGREIEFAQELYEIAMSDLMASELLYRKKHFRQAVYLLQQSVEKLTKADCLWRGAISIDQLKKIGHKFYKAIFMDDYNFLEKYANQK